MYIVLQDKHFLQTWGSHVWKLVKACLCRENNCSVLENIHITWDQTEWEVAIWIHKYFSSLYLHYGYYHISPTEEAKKKTAFITADGKYQWNVVPFGLATTVSTFQYLMSTVSTGLNNFTFTYLGFSEMYEDHLHHLNVVFEKFQKAGLKIKLSKCQFFKSHLHYLGHRISTNSLEPLPEKLEAIKNLAPARNVDEACHILGLLMLCNPNFV